MKVFPAGRPDDEYVVGGIHNLGEHQGDIEHVSLRVRTPQSSFFFLSSFRSLPSILSFPFLSSFLTRLLLPFFITLCRFCYSFTIHPFHDRVHLFSRWMFH